jgi:hypothetical protein
MLRPDTEQVWEFLRGRPELNGFALVGGSALAMVMHHRVSDDLVLAWVEARLPRLQLEQLATVMRAAGISWEPPDDRSVEPKVADHQQGYLANGTVRVTFFTPDGPLARVLYPAQPRAPVRLASLKELFGVTALLTAQRTRLRDWFDLYLLMREHGFTLDDYVGVFQRAGLGEGWSDAMAGICDRPLAASDPGFTSVRPDAPEPAELRRYFQKTRETWLGGRVPPGQRAEKPL